MTSTQPDLGLVENTGSPRDLIHSPRWQADDLGESIPDSPHAVSACLPRWQDNVDYEEHVAATIAALKSAYPRFCLHPATAQLFERHNKHSETVVFAFPTLTSAQRAAEYVCHRGGTVNGIHSLLSGGGPEGRLVPQAVTVPAEHGPLLKEYWQHTGEILSSRSAVRLLNDEEPVCTRSEARLAVRLRVAGLYGLTEESVALTVSGMAAATLALRLVDAVARQPHGDSSYSGEGGPAVCTAQFGFPYIDTLKIQQRLPGHSCLFLPSGNAEDLVRLQKHMEEHRLHAVFCEIPTNPLLQSPNLSALRDLCDRNDVLLIVDDTLGACRNLNILSYADIVFTSLTKYFSGYGDVTAGSVVINPDRPSSGLLTAALTELYEEMLTDDDLQVLLDNSDDLDQRVAKTNENSLRLAEYLQRHPAVKQVWYPGLGPDANYESVKNPDGGYGGLLSFVPRQPELNSPRVYDALAVNKGPNLGTRFSLCCPYTILAHYNELDFAESCGISPWLLRVSVGTEPYEQLEKAFGQALGCTGAEE